MSNLERTADELREDVCPVCGTRRRELLVVPGRFYCPRCKVAGEGPNAVAPEAAQTWLELPEHVRRAIAAQGKIDPDLVEAKARELETGEPADLTPAQERLFEPPATRRRWWDET